MKDKILTFLGGVVLVAIAMAGIAYLGSYSTQKESARSNQKISNENNTLQKVSENTYTFKTGLDLQDFPQKLIETGTIDLEKYQNLVGNLSVEKGEIVITPDNNQTFLNLFWGLGLAQENQYLVELKALKERGQLENLASVGGWIVAKGSASDHFSKHNILNLTLDQQKKVAEIAATIYRPCCGNSARFADCNHGMAMLGVLSLGVAQGLSDDELYNLALKFNSVWFPDQYNQLADYFLLIEKKKLSEVDPRVALSAKFSSAQGFAQNVARPLATLNLSSSNSNASGCSLQAPVPQPSSGCSLGAPAQRKSASGCSL